MGSGPFDTITVSFLSIIIGRCSITVDNIEEYVTSLTTVFQLLSVSDLSITLTIHTGPEVDIAAIKIRIKKKAATLGIAPIVLITTSLKYRVESESTSCQFTPIT